MACGMASAQTYMNVKLANSKYKSYEVTSDLQVTWGDKLQTTIDNHELSPFYL